MRLLGNVIWFLCGGILMALGWWLTGLIAYITVVGIPWARACFVIGNLCIAPFGKDIISRRELNGRDDIGTGTAGLIGNIIWFVLAGLWLALGHVISAILCFLTIIGIPFGIQHLKIAAISLMPIGKTVVRKEVADAARRANAEAYVAMRHLQ